MAVFLIPTRSDFDALRFQTTLDGLVYTFLLKKNFRDNSWSIDLLEQDETPIRNGIKPVVSFPLLRLVASRARPPGEILAIDTTGRFQLPNLEQLGTEVVLNYVDEAGVAGL
jgi:hypothetical protein